MKLEPIYYHEPDIYSVPGFKPRIIDRNYLKNLGVTVNPDEDTIEGLIRGSEQFISRLADRTVIPSPRVAVEKINLDT